MKLDPHYRSESVQRLDKLIKGIKVAMLTSIDTKGQLHSRPMMTQEVEFDGDLWFFTSQNSSKVFNIAHEQQVNVSYADPAQNTFVSVAGKVELVHDADKKEQLWKPIFRTWWPDGLEDPDIVLLKVSVQSAQYWDAPNSKLIQMTGFIKALLTHDKYNSSENEKVEFHH